MDYTGSIYRLIDRAEDEMKEYVASSMINQEVPIDTVKEILGHTQIGSMKAYMRISRDKLAMCALGLDGIEVVQEALL